MLLFGVMLSYKDQSVGYLICLPGFALLLLAGLTAAALLHPCKADMCVATLIRALG